MKKQVLIGLIIFVIGCFLIAISVAIGGSNVINVTNDSEYQPFTYAVDPDYSKIKVNVDIKDISIYKSSDDQIHINGYTSEKSTVDINKGETLEIISKTETRINFGFFNDDYRYHLIEIYIPENLMTDLDIYTRDGDIEVSNMTFNNFQADTVNGDIEIVNSEFKAIVDLETTNGDFELLKINPKQQLNIKSTNGDVEISLYEPISAYAISLETRFGDAEINEREQSSEGTGEITIDITTLHGDIEVTTK